MPRRQSQPAPHQTRQTSPIQHPPTKPAFTMLEPQPNATKSGHSPNSASLCGLHISPAKQSAHHSARLLLTSDERTT